MRKFQAIIGRQADQVSRSPARSFDVALALDQVIMFRV
jgi:hypothetical protein